MKNGNQGVPHGLFFVPPIENSYIGHQAKEVYFDRVYEPFLKGKKIGTVVDIGGNVGVTTYYFSQFADRVITVEPAKEHFETINYMLKHNGIKNVTVVNKALYIKEGDYNFYHNTNKTMYSLHTAVNDGSSAPEKVSTITIKNLFDQYDIQEVDLLKIDIEGSEPEIFAHPTFMEVAPKIKVLITERHAWNGRNPNQVDDALKMAGFTIQKANSQADIVIATR